jgi:hypothetical protein
MYNRCKWKCDYTDHALYGVLDVLYHPLTSRSQELHPSPWMYTSIALLERAQVLHSTAIMSFNRFVPWSLPVELFLTSIFSCPDLLSKLPREITHSLALSLHPVISGKKFPFQGLVTFWFLVFSVADLTAQLLHRSCDFVLPRKLFLHVGAESTLNSSEVL